MLTGPLGPGHVLRFYQQTLNAKPSFLKRKAFFSLSLCQMDEQSDSPRELKPHVVLLDPLNDEEFLETLRLPSLFLPFVASQTHSAPTLVEPSTPTPPPLGPSPTPSTVESTSQPTELVRPIGYGTPSTDSLPSQTPPLAPATPSLLGPTLPPLPPLPPLFRIESFPRASSLEPLAHRCPVRVACSCGRTLNLRRRRSRASTRNSTTAARSRMFRSTRVTRVLSQSTNTTPSTQSTSTVVLRLLPL